MPMVTDSWCTVPNAPRYLGGEVSDNTIGAIQFTRPTTNVFTSAAAPVLAAAAAANCRAGTD